ncbi:MAG: HD domain-containing protein [Fimbriimonadales bacterium]
MIESFDGSGIALCRTLSELADEALANVFANVCPSAEIAIVAVGGYGRKELGPASDLDFVFLANDSGEEDNVRSLYRAVVRLSSECNWEVDSALRYQSDAPGLDDKSRTALMDARMVVGSNDVYERFMAAYHDTFPSARFLADKRRERLEQRVRHGYSPRKIEFNLKEGAGGLRDYHAANWFRRILGAEPIGLPDDYDYVLATRSALHIATQRKEDKLLRTRHAEVAALLKKEPQHMFTRLIQCAERFQEEWRNALLLVRESRFELAPNVAADEGIVRIAPEATLSDAAEGISHGLDLDLHIPFGILKNAVVGDGPAAADFVASGAKYVRAFDRSGVLSALVPPFGDAQNLTSDDPVHEFTVGEHTLVVMDQLEKSKDLLLHSAAWSDADNRTLYLAALLHDLGKVDGSAPHAISGEQIARDVGVRLSLPKQESETIAWLVREHLTLAQIARTHDLQMPEAPLEVARICGDQSRLAMLYLLTLADISAVSGEALTPQLEASIRDLYEKARAIIGLPDLPSDPATYRIAALERMRQASPEGDMGDWLESMPTHYVIGTPRSLFPVHERYLERAKDGETVVVFENDNQAATTELTISTRDLERPGLLSRILGVIYAYDVSVHGVRAASTSDEQPLALDQITVTFRRGVVPKNLSAAISSSLKDCIRDVDKLEELLRTKRKDPDQRQHFLKYHFIEGEPAVIEFETPIGRGMPYRVTKMIAHFGWNVNVGRVGQWAGRAVSRFYLSKPLGRLSEDEVAPAIEGYRRGN